MFLKSFDTFFALLISGDSEPKNVFMHYYDRQLLIHKDAVSFYQIPPILFGSLLFVRHLKMGVSVFLLDAIISRMYNSKMV